MATPVTARPRITLAGGGGGAARMVKGLVEALPEAHISAVISVGDSGSRTGEAREVYGTVAMGDVWKNIRAVSGNDTGRLLKIRFGAEASADDLRRLNERLLGVVATTDANVDKAAASLEATARRTGRLPNGLQGHTYGGLVLTGLTLDHGNSAVKGARELSRWAAARATVIPVTDHPHDVVMWDRGTIIRGEGVIDDYAVQDPKTARTWLERGPHDARPPRMTPEAYKAVAESDAMLVGPGSIFTSLIPAIAVQGMAGALGRQKEHGGALVVVGNLVEERSSTPGMTLADYVAKLQGPTGRDLEQPITGRPFDYVIYNDSSAGFPEGKVPVRFDTEHITALGARAIGGNLVRIVAGEVDPNDPIAHLRSEADGIEHDVWRVAGLLQDQVLAEPVYAS